jgi:integrase
MLNVNLPRDSRGRYQADRGWERTESGEYRQHRFYLGKDQTQAAIRLLQIERIWDCVTSLWQKNRETHRPEWDATTLQMALAVARGETTIYLDVPDEERQTAACYPDSETVLGVWIGWLREAFPFLDLRIKGGEGELAEKALADVAARLDQQAQAVKETAANMRGRTGSTLRNALDAYATYVQEKYRDTGGNLTDFGGLCIRRIASMKEHLRDKTTTPLCRVDNTFLENWIIVWQKRPPLRRTGKPVSVSWAKSVIKQIRDFVRWLHKSSEFDWRKPSEYEVLPVTVKPTEEEIAEKPFKRVRYKKAEIAALWEYATPLERVYLLLALNCGFGLGEIVTLRLKELQADKDQNPVKIVRARRKTGTVGKWSLWPVTATALNWYLTKVRPTSDSPYVFLARSGRPLAQRTVSGNRSQRIATAWGHLHDRIRKDRPDFVKLSFNKLRKTGSNFIRRKYGGEIADLYLGHGKKEVVDAYTEKPFGLVHRAVRHYRRFLGDTLAGVAVPFPDTNRKSNPSVSRGTIKRIQELRRQGFKFKVIAEAVRVSVHTAIKYAKGR